MTLQDATGFTATNMGENLAATNTASSPAPKRQRQLDSQLNPLEEPVVDQAGHGCKKHTPAQPDCPADASG
jgi:hypothetical protein